MDWFLYENGLRHERVNVIVFFDRVTINLKNILNFNQKSSGLEIFGFLNVECVKFLQTTHSNDSYHAFAVKFKNLNL